MTPRTGWRRRATTIRRAWKWMIAIACWPALCGAAAIDAALASQARVPFSYRSWTIDRGADETTISQWVATTWAAVRLGEAWDLALTTSAAGSRLEEGGANGGLDLRGMNNLRAQLSGSFFSERLRLHAGASLPTGKRELTSGELGVAGGLWSPLLGFPLREYGEGFDVSAGLSWAIPAGEIWTLGVGGSAIRKGAYPLEEDGEDYDPGETVTLTAGADARFAAWLLQLDLTGRAFGKDRLGGDEIFQEGAQWEARIGATFPGRTLTGTLHVTGIWKGANEILTSAGEDPASITLDAGRTLHVSSEGRMALARAWAAGLGLVFTSFEGYEDDSQTGWSFGIGPLIGWSPGRTLRLLGRWLVLSGSADSGRIDLSGYDASLALVWSP